jgi:hypothetical protein
MPNSRMAYMEKADITAAGTTNVTFTPPFNCNTWQLRLDTNDDAQLSLAIQTIDEDGEAIHVDGSPFVQADGDFDSNGKLEITVDTSNPSIKVTVSGTGATATPKCKAYRSLDDTTGGGYTDIT